MKVDEIMKLIDAGFTRDEIINLESESVNSEAPSEDQPDVNQASDPGAELKNIFDDFLKGFKSVADDIKKSNIANSKMSEPEQTSAEQILASIVAPPPKERGKN